MPSEIEKLKDSLMLESQFCLLELAFPVVLYAKDKSCRLVKN